MRTWLRPASPRARLLLALALTLAVASAVVLAWRQPGFAQVPPVRDDRTVWVVNDARLLVGRVNTAIAELDSAALTRGVSQVVQDPVAGGAGQVFVIDQAKREMQVLDPRAVTFGARVTVPGRAAVRAAGGTLAVADPADGRLWIGTTDAVETVDSRAVPAQAEVGALPALAVSLGGTAMAAAPGSDAIVAGRPGAEAYTIPLPDGPLTIGGRVPQVTAVGETPVVLDGGDGTLRLPTGRIPLPGLVDAILQQPGPDSEVVVVATSNALVSVRLADGALNTLAELPEPGGPPAAPVVIGGCSFGAWPGTGVAACTGSGAVSSPLDGPTTAAGLDLAQRGSAVVLTDHRTGRSWLPDAGFRPVDNWADVAPPDPAIDETIQADEPTTTSDLPRLPPDCTAVPRGAPTAADDEFGVRAERATVLRVLDNDPSVDCTSVVINAVNPLPADVGTVAVVAGGSALQVTPAPGRTGVLPPIEYEVDNGAGATATARALVTVVPLAVTGPPERVRRSAITVEVNGTATYNVLDDYRSPVGDDLYLVSASTDGADAVSFRPDGTITYRSTGGGAGSERRVEFVVSDGVEQATGTLLVTIAAAESTTPVAYPAFTSAVVGATASAAPLRSVTSGSPLPVLIRGVSPEAGSEEASARVQPDGRVLVTAPAAGTYYFTFEAATGSRAVTGVLRADFTEPSAQSRAVVPMADVAYLPQDGSVLIDPLANDTDPDGQGLAVRELDIPVAGTGVPSVSASVLDLHLVQVAAPRPLTRSVAVNYAVFDGATTQRGQIRVVPVPAPSQIPPPSAAPIPATVRAGDAVTIRVARFASSQDGTPVTAELDGAQLAGLPGRAFSTGDSIRYLAPPGHPPGPVTFSYVAVSASDTPLQPVRTVSTVTVTVTDPDPSRNAPPQEPPTAIARVFAGGSIEISAPLAGVDPDGDWVVLQALEQPAAPLGDVRIGGPDTLSYTAFDAPGVDRLRYVATDPLGATVVGVITVLVVEPGTSARPPMAPDLAVAVRPGASIRIDPLAAVVDPGGQRVQLGSPPFTASAGLQVMRDGQGLIVTAPAEPTVATLRYTVINAKGLTATGSVQVTVSPDAPLPAPLARDVFVRPEDLSDSARTVDVDVSGSVVNRSGRTADLALSIDPLSADRATVVASQVLRVTVSTSRQIVAYVVTDAAGSSASAFVVVPPRAQLVGPQLIASAGAIRVDAGATVEVSIADHVTVGGRGDPVIAATPALRATQGTAIRRSGSAFALEVPSTAGGPAAVYVPVENGEGGVTVLALPVEIAPRVVPPPRLDDSELAVEAGTVARLDLTALTTTFDEQQRVSLRYAAGQGSVGVEATLTGGTVSVTARPDVPRGTVVPIPIEVRDGDGLDGRATLTVRVTGSTLPLATVPDRQVTEGRGGVQVAVDMLSGSTDPVGLGLTIAGATVLEGAAGVADGPTAEGSVVRLTPAAGYAGDLLIGVDIADGTKDPERVVRATLRVSIQDRPSPPGTPGLVDGTLGSASVQLVWAPAAANGSPISVYRVLGSGIAQDCPGDETSCVIDGLMPGRAYVFAVTAVNAVGASDPSPPSAAIVPDAAPSAPPAPAVEYRGRGSLTVGWTVPAGEFTPVTSSDVQLIVDEVPGEIRSGVTPPLQLDGLDPGASYRFLVRAQNAAGTGEWSDASAAVIPSGVPAEPTGLVATFVADGARRAVDIQWAPPADDGGEPIQGYRLLIDNVQAGSGGTDYLAASLDVATDQPVAIRVVASNARGEGPPSAEVIVTPFSRPDQVTGLTVTPGDGSVTATWAAAGSSGRPVAEYQYRVDGGGWSGVGPGTSVVLPGLTNGTTYQLQVRACNSEQGFPEQVRCGPESAAVVGRPYGPLAPPTVSAELTEPWATTVTLSWTFPGGNGRDVTERSVRVTGGQDLDPDAGTWTGDIGPGESVEVVVRYCVTSPADCRDVIVSSPTTPIPVELQVVGPDPLTGTCGEEPQVGGAWVDEAGCSAGSWRPVGQDVPVWCAAGGPDYPQSPPATTEPPAEPVPEISSWYLGVDGLWYRTPALQVSASAPPSC